MNIREFLRLLLGSIALGLYGSFVWYFQSLYQPSLALFVLVVWFGFCFFVFVAASFWDCRQSEKLKNKLDSKEELISIAAHELSAPLANIKGTLSLLGREVSPPSKVFLDRAAISVEELISLIDNLLTVSRFEMGRIEITPKFCNLREICEQVTSELSAKAKENGLTLEFKDATLALSQVPQVFADPERIREVVSNFVSNAIKYTESGSVIVYLEREARNLTVSVADTGPGIKPAEVKYLFKRFVRLPKTKNGHKGAGLGLYISRLIVEAHKGRIWVERHANGGQAGGQGSRFSFSLPL